MIDLARKATAEVLFRHGFPVSAQDALEGIVDGGIEVQVALAAICMARQEGVMTDIERLSAENERLSKEVRLWERMATKSGGQLQQVKDAIQTLHGIALAGEAGHD